jgi:hypothetical protein
MSVIVGVKLPRNIPAINQWFTVLLPKDGNKDYTVEARLITGDASSFLALSQSGDDLWAIYFKKVFDERSDMVEFGNFLHENHAFAYVKTSASKVTQVGNNIESLAAAKLAEDYPNMEFKARLVNRAKALWKKYTT